VHPIAQVFAALAAALHVAIFVMESVLWSKPAVWARFGVASQNDADITKPMAFNQGFYNLFLAVEIAVGIVVVAAGGTAVGATLVFVGAGSMVAAGLVLLLSDRSKTRPALIQLTPPLLGIVALAVGLAS
jgi:putative membrane protein